MGFDIDESSCDASSSPPVNQADHICEELSLHMTIEPEWEILPLQAFKHCKVILLKLSVKMVRSLSIGLSSQASSMTIRSGRTPGWTKGTSISPHFSPIGGHP